MYGAQTENIFLLFYTTLNLINSVSEN